MYYIIFTTLYPVWLFLHVAGYTNVDIRLYQYKTHHIKPSQLYINI